MLRCPNCGEDATPEADRCARCGAALSPPESAGGHRASVLVVDLLGPDGSRLAAAEGSGDEGNPLVERARREIRLLGGAVQPSEDHTTIGAFAARGRSDAAERAVRAALRLREAVECHGGPPAAVVRAAVHTRAYLDTADPALAADRRRWCGRLPRRAGT
jgi:hypothetical protein